jgi:hypothetical protein
MKIASFVAILATAAGVAQAAQVNVTGAHTTSATGNNQIGVNQAAQNSFSAGSGSNFVTGVVRFSNTFDGTSQVLELTLTNFTWSSNSATPVTLRIDMVQDYTVAGSAVSATGSHQLNGNAVFANSTQSATVVANSTHESTALPVLSYNSGVDGNSITKGQGATTSVAISGGVYTIAASYVFTLSANGAVASIVLPDSGVNNASLTLVPLPPAAWAGLGGLAFVGGASVARRRRLARA